MSMGPEGYLGSAWIRVGYDTSDLDRQERDLERRARRLAARLGRNAGPGGDGPGPAGAAARRPTRGGGPTGDAMAAKAVDRAAGALIGTFRSSIGGLRGEVRKQGVAQARATDASVDNLASIAKSLKVVAEASKEQLLAANDLRRAASQDTARGALNRRINRIFGTGLDEAPTRRVGHLAPEARLWSGMGFGGGPGGFAGAAGAAMLGGGARTGEKLERAAERLYRAAVRLDRGGRGGGGARAAGADPLAAMTARRGGYHFASDFVTDIGATPRAKAMGARPGHYQRRRNGVIGWQFHSAGGVKNPNAPGRSRTAGIDPRMMALLGIGGGALIGGAGGIGGALLGALGAGGIGLAGIAGKSIYDNRQKIRDNPGMIAKEIARAVKDGIAGAYGGAKRGAAFVGRQAGRARAAGEALGAAKLAGVPGAGALFGGAQATAMAGIGLAIDLIATKGAVALPLLKGIGATIVGYAPAAAAGSAAILGLGNTINLLKHPFRTVSNAIRHFEHNLKAIKLDPFTRAVGNVGKAVVSGITFPMRLALRAMGLFDSRASVITNTLRALGKTLGGLRIGLALPFRTALAPVGLLTTSVRNLAAIMTLLAPAFALRGLYKAVELADELYASIGRAETAFHGAASSIIGLADDLAAKVGAVNQEVIDLGANMGLLFTGVGIAEGQAAKMATDLTKLAQDMAATFGAPVEELKGAFLSALAGQYEPLRRYDVLLRQQDINQRAVADGLADVTYQVSFQAKALATYNLIMERAVKFQGGLAANMNTFGSLVTEIRGRITNLATELGKRLYPAARELALLIVDILSGSSASGLLDAIGAVADRFKQGVHFVRQMIAGWSDAVELVRLVGKVAKQNVLAAANYMGSVLVSGAQKALALVVDLMGAAFNGVRSALEHIWDGIAGDMVRALVLGAQKAGQGIRKFLTDPNGAVWEFIGQGVADALGGDQVDRALDRTRSDLERIIEDFTGIDLPPIGLEIDPKDQDRIDALVDRLSNIRLRGDEPDDRSLQSKKPGWLGEEQAVAEGKSRTGLLVTAEQLREMQAQGELGRTQVKLLERIAENTNPGREAARAAARAGKGALAALATPAGAALAGPLASGAARLAGAVGASGAGKGLLAGIGGALKNGPAVARFGAGGFVGPPTLGQADLMAAGDRKAERSKALARQRQEALKMAEKARDDRRLENARTRSRFAGKGEDKTARNTGDTVKELKKLNRILATGGPTPAVAV